MRKGCVQIALVNLLVYQLIIAHGENVTVPAAARRALLKREQNYLKKQPMSRELKELIEKIKMKLQLPRTKRSDIAENQVFIVKDGQLVPFKNVKRFSDLNNEASSPGTAYTVVPLLLPVGEQHLANEHLVKTRNSEPPPAAPAPPASVAPPEAGVPSPSTSLEAAVDDSSEETVVLKKILADVEGLMAARHGLGGNANDGVTCSVNGSWVSDAAGKRFDIDIKEMSRKKFRIHVANRIPPNEEGFICDDHWSVFGELPFSHSGVILILAVHAKDKHLAMFIGECRVCEGSESVSGTWLLGRSSRDCKDQKASHQVLSDIWRKEETHILRKKHLMEIGIQSKDED